MLGWDFVVYAGAVQGDNVEPSRPRLASWSTGPGGTAWIEKLCTTGEAVDLGGNGYPKRYVMTAAVLRAALREGVPRHDSPPVVGEDYFLPGGWTGKLEVDGKNLDVLPDHALLTVDAWDQS